MEYTDWQQNQNMNNKKSSSLKLGERLNSRNMYVSSKLLFL